MFLLSRPSESQIESFVSQSQALPLSYKSSGLIEHGAPNFALDELSEIVGHGKGTFERAKVALTEWRHFELGWVELFPRGAPIEPGTVVAVLVRHLGLWSLNGCRVLYTTGDRGGASFGFAYGTLTNHAECGEELFEVSLNEREEVIYRIRAVSKPHAALARLGYPFTRMLQARFRRDSIQAMRRALESRSPSGR